MTTAWAHVMRGQLQAALRVNVGGTLLALQTMIAIGMLTAGALRGRVPHTASGVVAIVGLLLVMGIALVEWVWRIG